MRGIACRFRPHAVVRRPIPWPCLFLLFPPLKYFSSLLQPFRCPDPLHHHSAVSCSDSDWFSDIVLPICHVQPRSQQPAAVCPCTCTTARHNVLFFYTAHLYIYINSDLLTSFLYSYVSRYRLMPRMSLPIYIHPCSPHDPD